MAIASSSWLTITLLFPSKNERSLLLLVTRKGTVKIP